MGILDGQSIRSKLTRAFLLTSGISLAIAGAALVTHDIISFRKGTVENLSTLVRVIAENSTAPLSFADPQAARDTLDGLRAEPQIVYAAIFQRDGRLFAEYRSAKAASAAPQFGDLSTSPWSAAAKRNGAHGYVFNDHSIDVYKDILHMGDSLGFIIVRADLTALVARLYWNMAALLALLATAGAAAYIMAGRFQKKIADPILSLEAAMHDFSVNQNKSAFVVRATDDEIGRLIDGFNTMVEQLSTRDRKLEEATHELKLAKESAEAANAAKSRYIATMSHEIRGPMTGVLAMSDLLVAKGLDAPQDDYARVIRRSAEHLVDFVNNVLDYAKIESGRMTLESIDFSLQEVIANVIAGANGSAYPRGIEISNIIAPGIPDRLRGDPVRLKQILANLVGNAVKFTEAGSVSLRISPAPCETVAGDAKQTRLGLRFEVTDTGIGIPDEAQANLFQAFRQADSSTSRRFGGSGLGLAIAKELVELMEGRIAVHSQPGHGSTFSFDVMFARTQADDASAAQPAPARHDPAVEPARGFSGKRILLAEDNRLNQEVASTVLRHFHCDVDVVDDGAKAVAAATTGHYDLILMDWQMPTMDGFSAAQTIRDLEKRAGAAPRVPIVLTTATAAPPAEAGRATAVDDYLPKPYRIRDVAQLLGRWIPTHGAVRTLDISTDTTEQATCRALVDESTLTTIRTLQNPNQPDLVDRIIDLFFSHSQSLMDELRVAWQHQDAQTVLYSAHSLKSIASNVGACALSRLCGDLEGQTKQEQWSDARDTYGRIIACHKDTCMELNAHKGKGNAQRTKSLRSS